MPDTVRLPVLRQSEAEALFSALDSDALFFDDPQPIADENVLPLLSRPRHRTQCEKGVRPCPWVTCRYHLYLDVRGDGVLRLNFPDREPEEMTVTCSLDLASDGPRTLEAVAALMGMSKERARQIEASAMLKFRRAFRVEED